ncbi:hypothetical protein CCACVL1_04795 [Corchorus capsularis]|uniref:Uncharacterized protein n=1 Tax=Corchorus capsularis TaxID=210143 RepID=A0A1R3JPL5_COCAP|nr:hypothetical protein CCACVL1_04795 [Corchorus capsularis]
MAYRYFIFHSRTTTEENHRREWRQQRRSDGES